jgi:hypothetical protein
MNIDQLPDYRAPVAVAGVNLIIFLSYSKPLKDGQIITFSKKDHHKVNKFAALQVPTCIVVARFRQEFTINHFSEHILVSFYHLQASFAKSINLFLLTAEYCLNWCS